jgi:hypothetical protein
MLEVRRYRKRLEHLINQWTEYRSLVLNRMGAPNLKNEEEKRFLNLKGKVAEDLTNLTSWLQPSLTQEVQGHLRGITSLMGRYPTLFTSGPLDEQNRTEFERSWHDHFLFFNRLKGIRPDTHGRDPRNMAVATQAYIPPVGQKVHKRSAGAHFITIFLRILFLIFVIFILVKYVPWQRLSEPTTSTTPNPGGMQGFILTAGDRVKAVMAGVHLPAFLNPVVEAYGSEVTTILVAVFLLIVAYFIFGRMK